MLRRTCTLLFRPARSVGLPAIRPAWRRSFYFYAGPSAGAGTGTGTPTESGGPLNLSILNDLRSEKLSFNTTAPPEPLPYVSPFASYPPRVAPEEAGEADSVFATILPSSGVSSASAQAPQEPRINEQSIQEHITNARLREALQNYHDQRTTHGNEFYIPAHASITTSLGNAFFQMGLLSARSGTSLQSLENAVQYFNTAFNLAADSILMLLGHWSPEYAALVDNNWYRESPKHLIELCTLLSKPLETRRDTPLMSQARILAGRALFAVADFQQQGSQQSAQEASRQAMYDLAAHFFNSALTSLLRSATLVRTSSSGVSSSSGSASSSLYGDIFECRRMLALCYRRRRQFEWAWLVLEDGVRECKKTDDAIIGVYWADIGATCLDARRFNSGVDAFERALRCRFHHAVPAFRAHVLTGLAQCLAGMANIKGAVVAFQEAIEHATQALEAEPPSISLQDVVEIHATSLDFVNHVNQYSLGGKMDRDEFDQIRRQISESTNSILDRWDAEKGSMISRQLITDTASTVTATAASADWSPSPIRGSPQDVGTLLGADDVDIPMLRMGSQVRSIWKDGEYLKDEVLQNEKAAGKFDLPKVPKREGIDTLM